MPSADELIGVETAGHLIGAIASATPAADLTALRQAQYALAGLPLRQRSDLLRDALISSTDRSYDKLAHTVRTACVVAPEFRGWLIWPVTSAIAEQAIVANTTEAFDDALSLLADLTGRLTAEFALRRLLQQDLDRALATIRMWTISPDEHIRRLASEGTRPYLPWGNKVPGIMAAPGRTVPLLDALYHDESEYVRRSVANHLNDLSRDHPEIVIATARRWLTQPDVNTANVVRHGLRTLIKRGNPEALEILGFAPASVDVVGPTLDQELVPFGGIVRFTATVTNTGTESIRLAIDYVVDHVKANGTLTSKTFKLTTCTLSPKESVQVGKVHSFRPISTRRYYPGRHAMSLQVNGRQSLKAEFDLLPPH